MEVAVEVCLVCLVIMTHIKDVFYSIFYQSDKRNDQLFAYKPFLIDLSEPVLNNV